MRNVLKYSKMVQNGSVRLRLFFQFTCVQYCKTDYKSRWMTVLDLKFQRIAFFFKGKKWYVFVLSTVISTFWSSGSSSVIPCIRKLNTAQAGASGRWQCCFFHYCQWTVWIKPSLQFSLFFCLFCFREIISQESIEYKAYHWKLESIGVLYFFCLAGWAFSCQPRSSDVWIFHYLYQRRAIKL